MRSRTAITPRGWAPSSSWSIKAACTDRHRVTHLATVTVKPLRFRSDLEVSDAQQVKGKMRCTVYDQSSDVSYSLGLAEVRLARRFDGQRELCDIARCLLVEEGRVVSIEKLQTFQARLLELDLLTDESLSHTQSKRTRRDPALGITYGPLKARLMINLIRFDPSATLDLIYRGAPFLCAGWFIALLSTLIFGMVATVLFGNAVPFWQDVVRVYQGGVLLLVTHYAVVVLSSLLHEFGHALACRHYRVRITELGVAVYLLLATGWARPVQREWSALSRWQRIVTILMGPFVSLVFAACGVLLWCIVPAHSWLASVAIVMAISASAAIVPTLLPIFNGDAYLALTEWIGVPGLRSEAFQYVGSVLRNKPQAFSVQRKCLHWSVVTGTCAGWLVAWIVIYHYVSTFL